MKTRIILFAVATITTGLFFTSCEKDDDTVSKPQIDNFELGLENSKIGYAGSDLHVEAEVIAEGKIDNITLEIHPEGEEKSTSVVFHEGEWEFDSVYTEFSGLKNTTFHKHIDIPADADTGHYHFHIIVTDMEGNQTSVEEEFAIQYTSDEVAPVITVSGAPSNNQVFADGESISISGSVSDDNALGGMYIGLVREGQNLTDAEVNATNTITILHTHDFDNPVSYNFSASITVGAAQDNNITPKDITGDIAWQSANYYIVVKCKDAYASNWTFSEHYPIVIDY